MINKSPCFLSVTILEVVKVVLSFGNFYDMLHFISECHVISFMQVIEIMNVKCIMLAFIFARLDYSRCASIFSWFI